LFPEGVLICHGNRHCGNSFERKNRSPSHSGAAETGLRAEDSPCTDNGVAGRSFRKFWEISSGKLLRAVSPEIKVLKNRVGGRETERIFAENSGDRSGDDFPRGVLNMPAPRCGSKRPLKQRMGGSPRLCFAPKVRALARALAPR
jgi:hypothetical protein